PRQNLLNAASRVGEASHQVLTTIGEEDDSNRELQDMLLALAKAVANTTAALVLKAKNIAATCEDSATQNRVISAATQCALATSQLVACAKVVAPTLHSPACQTQLMNAVREVTKAVERLVEVCNETCGDENLLKELSIAASEVSRTLNDLLNHIKTATRGERAKESVQEGAVETILVATDRLFASTGDAGEMVRQARVVGQATAQLIQSIKGEAERQTDSEQQQRLLAAAKLLADATAKMVEAARQCASSPHDARMQDQLRQAAEELRAATTAAATPALRRKLITRLEACAKQAASTATQCIAASSGAGHHNTNPSSQEELNMECRTIAQHVPHLFLQPGTAVVKAARAVLPTVTDQASAMQLNNTSQQLGSSLADLRSAVTRAREACGGLELDAAEELINSLKDELGEFYRAVEAASLRPLPEETTESTALRLGATSKNVGFAMAQLLSAAKQAATSNQPETQKKVLMTADDNEANLAAVAKDVSNSLNKCVSCLPGQRDVDEAIRNIDDMAQMLNMNEFPQTSKSYGQLQSDLNNAAANLNDASSNIVSSVRSPVQLATSSRQFTNAFGDLLGVGMEMAGHTAIETRSQVVVSLKNVTMTSGKLLVTAKSVAADPTAPNAKNQLSAAARAVTDSINYLVDVCTSAAPGQNECDNAIRNIQSMRSLLDNPSEPISDASYFECLETVMEKSKSLGDAVRGVSSSICGLIEAAAQAAYLAGVSDPTSVAEQVLSAATIIAKHTSAVCNACRLASSKTSNPVAKRHFVQSAKDVANSTACLVKEIKALDKNYSDTNREKCTEATKPLLEAVDNLCTFASSPEFASQPAKISIAARAAQEPITSAGKSIIDGSCAMVQAAKSLAAPGQKECDAAIEKLSARIRELDAASASELREKLEPLRTAAKYEAENVGHAVNQIALYSEPLVSGAIGAASNMESAGNPKAVALHSEVDETVELEDHRMSTIDTVDSYVDYQTRMVEAAKEIARLAQEMSTKSSTDVARLGPLAVDISHKYTQLARDTSGASAAASNADVSAKLRTGVQELGRACADIVRAAGTCQMSPGDAYAQREVAEHSKNVTEKVSQVLAALQAGSRGTQACINAASTVSGIIGDLDTTIMFATAGTLHAENESDTFADHRENILQTAKALVEDTKTLVAGAASSQEQLAVAAQNAVSTIVQLAEVVKYGAASLGSQNPEAQVMLINAVKDVASALGDLIHATKAASGKPINDPSMAHLKDSAKVMVTNVTSLLKTVKAVEDEHTRGTRALESTIEAIAQEIRALNSSETQKSHVTPEDLVRCTKSITLSTAKAVSAGNSCKQDDIIAAANMGRKSISDMLTICKGAAYNCAETAELRDRTLQAGHDVAINYRELLQAILQISSRSGDAKHTLPVISRKIAQSVTELVAVAELLKGNDWVDPDDPTVIAENELLGAAASIDAAAKKLASLRPRRSIQETNEDMNFDEMILEAAKSIAAATSALIKAASAAQRELIATGKVSRTPLTSSDDGQWSEGLISAARMVAAATHSLVESANALVQGVSSEEKLISSAKQVASSTAQLLVACKVKADPDSESTKRLQAAGNAVKRATDNLVRAAQQAIQQEEDRSLVLNRRMVGGIAQEIDARSEVLRIERELEEARGRLTAIRLAKYKNRSDLADGDGDVAADQSGYQSYTTRYETRAYEPQTTPSPIQTMNHTLDQLQSTTQHISHQFGGDRQNLISPEKVHSTQSTLERKMKDSQYHRSAVDNQYGSLDRKYIIDSHQDRSPYVVTERKIITDNSPGQYSSIERRINQESYIAERRHADGIASYATPPPQHILYSPKPPSTIPKIIQEQTLDDPKSSQDQQKYPTDRFSGVSPMSTFRSEKQVDTQRFGSSVPQHQTFKNIESKVIPGGRIETITTKMYTSTPGKSSSSNYETSEETKEYATSGNDLSTFKGFDNDSLEERTMKQSMHKVTEKKTVTMTMSSRQESNTKTFRYEDKQ
ncbi:talin-1-like protein, partial [Lasius niger]